MNLAARSCIALLGLMSFSAERVSAAELFLTVLDPDSNPFVLKFDMNPEFDGWSTYSDQRWNWTNASPSNLIISSISGGPVSGQFTMTSETFSFQTIDSPNDGYLGYSAAGSGLSYGEYSFNSLTWRFSIDTSNIPYTPSSASSIPFDEFFPFLPGDYSGSGKILFLVSPTSFMTLDVTHLSVQLTAIPEPSSLIFLGAGGALFLGILNARRRA